MFRLAGAEFAPVQSQVQRRAPAESFSQHDIHPAGISLIVTTALFYRLLGKKL